MWVAEQTDALHTKKWKTSSPLNVEGKTIQKKITFFVAHSHHFSFVLLSQMCDFVIWELNDLFDLKR